MNSRKADYQVIIKGELEEDDGWSVDWPGAGWMNLQSGICPDCCGEWVWAEAGYVPGTRKCRQCGSMFSAMPGRKPTIQRERCY
jgi:hypothetical protein